MKSTACHVVRLALRGDFCSRPARAFSKVDLPAPGGPSSSVMRPGRKQPLMSSSILKRCLFGFIKRTDCKAFCSKTVASERGNTHMQDFATVQLLHECLGSCMRTHHGGKSNRTVTKLRRVVATLIWHVKSFHGRQTSSLFLYALSTVGSPLAPTAISASIDRFSKRTSTLANSISAL